MPDIIMMIVDLTNVEIVNEPDRAPDAAPENEYASIKHLTNEDG